MARKPSRRVSPTNRRSYLHLLIQLVGPASHFSPQGRTAPSPSFPVGSLTPTPPPPSRNKAKQTRAREEACGAGRQGQGQGQAGRPTKGSSFFSSRFFFCRCHMCVSGCVWVWVCFIPSMLGTSLPTHLGRYKQVDGLVGVGHTEERSITTQEEFLCYAHYLFTRPLHSYRKNTGSAVPLTSSNFVSHSVYELTKLSLSPLLGIL